MLPPRIRQYVPVGLLLILVAVAVEVVIEQYTEQYHLSVVVTLLLLASSPVLSTVVGTPPWARALIFAHRREVTITILAVTVGLGLLFTPPKAILDLLRQTSHAAFREDQTAALRPLIFAFGFMVQGGVLGYVFRMLTGIIFLRTIVEGEVITHRLILTLVVLFFILLFPIDKSHSEFAGYFLFGIGFGFFVQSLIRKEEHSRAERYRHGQHIVRLIGTSDQERLPKDVQQMMIDFANMEFRKLDRELKRRKDDVGPGILVALPASR